MLSAHKLPAVVSKRGIDDGNLIPAGYVLNIKEL
jgi:hypothetical protein